MKKSLFKIPLFSWFLIDSFGTEKPFLNIKDGYYLPCFSKTKEEFYQRHPEMDPKKINFSEQSPSPKSLFDYPLPYPVAQQLPQEKKCNVKFIGTVPEGMTEDNIKEEFPNARICYPIKNQERFKQRNNSEILMLKFNNLLNKNQNDSIPFDRNNIVHRQDVRVNLFQVTFKDHNPLADKINASVMQPTENTSFLAQNSKMETNQTTNKPSFKSEKLDDKSQNSITPPSKIELSQVQNPGPDQKAKSYDKIKQRRGPLKGLPQKQKDQHPKRQKKPENSAAPVAEVEQVRTQSSLQKNDHQNSQNVPPKAPSKQFGIQNQNGKNVLIFLDGTETIQYPKDQKDVRNWQKVTNIIIPDSATQIDPSIFSKCENLENITIKYGKNFKNQISILDTHCRNNFVSINIIIDQSFDQNELHDILLGIRVPYSIEITMHIQKIEAGAFCNCSYLAGIVLPSSVTDIEDYAFAGCTNLTHIDMPSVKRIGPSAFFECQNLSDVPFPSTLISIADNAFASCKSLKKILLPSSVQQIGASSFSCCTSLKQLTLSPLTSIPWMAFFGCELLEKVEIPVPVQEIGEQAFFGCKKLVCTILNSETKIGDQAFEHCKFVNYPGLSSNQSNKMRTYTTKKEGGKTTLEFYQGVESIASPENEVKNFKQVTHIIIPASVQKIKPSLFYGCKNLQNISVEFGQNFETQIEAIRDIQQKNSHFTVTILVPTGVIFLQRLANALRKPGLACVVDIQERITRVPSKVFDRCLSLTEINLPNSVSVIEDFAFIQCHNLQKINLSNSVETIGKGAFAYCSSLPCIILPNSVKEIGTACFAYCQNLQQIILSSSLISIPPFALFKCDSLPTILIPGSITYFDQFSFCFCKNLKQVVLTKGNFLNKIQKHAFSCCKVTSTNDLANIPSAVNVNSEAFSREISLAECGIELLIQLFGRKINLLEENQGPKDNNSDTNNTNPSNNSNDPMPFISPLNFAPIHEITEDYVSSSDSDENQDPNANE